MIGRSRDGNCVSGRLLLALAVHRSFDEVRLAKRNSRSEMQNHAGAYFHPKIYLPNESEEDDNMSDLDRYNPLWENMLDENNVPSIMQARIPMVSVEEDPDGNEWFGTEDAVSSKLLPARV
jgi:hypothetical protein